MRWWRRKDREQDLERELHIAQRVSIPSWPLHYE
jgi:hypothetical protein